MKYLVINLKSNKTLNEILKYKKSLKNCNLTQTEFILFPTISYIPFFYDAPYKIGSQTISIYQSGSYTGEVLAAQLKSLKVSYVLLNHSETHDSPEHVILKIKNATKEQLKIILCIGENLKQRVEETKQELINKINQIFSKLTKEEQQNCILAYEPIWAIQGNETQDPMILRILSEYLHQYLKENYQIELPILYGGSINIKNLETLTKIDNIDGFLIGNCANNPDNLMKILEKM